MKKIFTLLFFSMLSACVMGQSAIVPVGGDAQSGTGSVSYTVGQVVTQTATNSNGSISVAEGVQPHRESRTVDAQRF